MRGGKDQEDSMTKKEYWVVCCKSVSNPAAFSEYAKLAATALAASGGRVIVGGKPAKTHEARVDQSVSAEHEAMKRQACRLHVSVLI
jgi:uncharacterized protein (DUF1330 family)